MARFISPITDMKPNGHLLFFKSGTSTALVTFMDEVETIPNLTNVPVGPNGNLGNVFFSGSAKVRYFDQFGAQYAERDPVGGEKELGDFSLWDNIVVYDKGDFVEGSDGNFYQSVSNGNVGNDPTLVDSAWKEIPFNGIYSAGVSYPIGEVVQTTDGGMWKSVVASNAGNDPTTDDGSNWLPASSKKWIPKSSSFNVNASVNYSVTAAAPLNASLKSSYSIGDPILVKSDPLSTSNVTLVNSSLSITNRAGTITGGTNIILKPGDVFRGVATGLTTIARFDELPIVNIDNIDFSKLDNPLCHLYKTNQLVTTINGVLTSLRADRPTFADINGVVRTAVKTDDPREETTGWLFEGISNNEAIHRRDFTNAAYVKTNLTALKDAIGHDGVANAASTLTSTAANGTAFQTVTKASAENTYSIDVRRKTGAGTIEISDDGGSTFTDITSSINSVIYTRFQITTTQANPEFGVRIVTSGDEVEVDYAQLEELEFASSRMDDPLLPAVSTSRLADNQSIPVEGNFRMSEGSIFLKADVIGDTGTDQYMLNINDGTNNNRVAILRDSGSKIRLVISNGGVTQVNFASSLSMDVGAQPEIALNYKDDDVELFIDGVSVGTDTSCTLPTNLTTTSAGKSVSGFELFGHIADLRFYKENLTIDEIKYLGGQ